MAQVPRKPRSWFWHPLVTVVLLVIAGVSVSASAKLLNTFQLARGVRDREQTRVHDLEVEYEQILARLDKIQTPEGFEREVKDRYRVARAGEELIVVLSGDETGEPIIAPAEDLTWWRWLVSLFKR